jgi:hypothetical protein
MRRSSDANGMTAPASPWQSASDRLAIAENRRGSLGRFQPSGQAEGWLFRIIL